MRCISKPCDKGFHCTLTPRRFSTNLLRGFFFLRDFLWIAESKWVRAAYGLKSTPAPIPMTVLLTLQEFLTCTQSPCCPFSEIYREYAVATQRRKLQRIIEKYTFPSDGNTTDSGDSLRFSEKLLRTSMVIRILFQLARSNELDYSAGGR